jgi:hypothetical protein
MICIKIKYNSIHNIFGGHTYYLKASPQTLFTPQRQILGKTNMTDGGGVLPTISLTMFPLI